MGALLIIMWSYHVPKNNYSRAIVIKDCAQNLFDVDLPDPGCY